jgi:hypothetical protein
VSILEFPLASYPFVLVSGVLTPSGLPHLRLKKALVFWAILSLIMAGFCMYEGAALGYGLPRVLWSYVYIVPACFCLYYAARLRKR